jgi:DNA repair exonuclease SbcCD ATPase subunit
MQIKKFTFLFSLLFAGTAFAQSIPVHNGSEKFSSGSHDAVITTIYENNLQNVMDEWKQLMKDYKNEKVKANDNEIFGDNILVKDWGNNPVDFYARFDEDKKDKTVKMAVAVDLGGTYLSSSVDKDKHKYVEKMVKDFAIKMTKEPIEQSIKDQNKALDKLNDQQKGLEKDKKNLQDDIVGYKNKITKDEKDLAEKKADLDKKKGEVAVQKKVVDASSDAVSEQAKSSKKIHEKLMGQQKDLENDVKDLEKDIKNYQEKIKDAEKNIKTNDENQVKKKQEVENQKKVVDDLKKKLEKVS